ncbi:hypothetical protein CPC08DRAFT_756513 [Agrocybe pediades]|nr:hypothetical protein CPC08DRAFT_756513 [Agrocybe pediades]
MKGRLYRKDTDSPGSASKSKRSPIHTVIINEDADSHLDTDSEDQRAARIQEPAGTMVFLTSPGSTIAVNSYARNAIAGSNMSFRHWDITGQRYRGSLFISSLPLMVFLGALMLDFLVYGVHWVETRVAEGGRKGVWSFQALGKGLYLVFRSIGASWCIILAVPNLIANVS